MSSVDASPPPGSERARFARRALMDATERLVALHGEDGASSRAILRAANQRHKSGVDYYFGSRRGLLDAVWVRGSQVVNDRRRELIARSTDTEPDLDFLVHIYISPFAAYIADQTPSYWARFNEQALQRYPLLVASGLRTALSDYPQQQPLDTLLGIFEEMQKLVEGGRQPEAALRVSMVVRMVVSTFAAWEREAEHGRAELGAVELGEHLASSAVRLLADPGSPCASARS